MNTATSDIPSYILNVKCEGAIFAHAFRPSLTCTTATCYFASHAFANARICVMFVEGTIELQIIQVIVFAGSAFVCSWVWHVLFVGCLPKVCRASVTFTNLFVIQKMTHRRLDPSSSRRRRLHRAYYVVTVTA
eukprot:scaffold111_cov142-Skeletonema_menzelii.AAC.10